eukprot:GEMP01019620.1.p1 GENE.GEMP01019620.1~~GEMP01019620.1.p1  ORF type:complete len:333 (+),score=64.34 GEMP01019620.1:173-1171(+)
MTVEQVEASEVKCELDYLLTSLGSTADSPKRKVPMAENRRDSGSKTPDDAEDKQKGVRRRELFARTQMCVFYLAGTCARGAKCTYAHSDREMSVTPDLYKTALCAKFVCGNCNDENCTYAHGIHELRSAPETFKTSICRYFQKGDCKLGRHCRYSHSLSKMKKPLLENLCGELLAMRKQHEEEFRERLSKEKSVLQQALAELTNQLQEGKEVSEAALTQLAQYSQDTKHLFELSAESDQSNAIGSSCASRRIPMQTPERKNTYMLPHVQSWPAMADNEQVLTSSEWDHLHDEAPFSKCPVESQSPAISDLWCLTQGTIADEMAWLNRIDEPI